MSLMDLYAWNCITGNADGLGSVRKLEMVTACSVLKVHLVET